MEVETTLHDLTPEARYRRRLREGWRGQVDRFRPGARGFEVVKCALLGVYRDGFIHAGNLAFLSLLALFPFAIVAAAITKLLGETDWGLAIVQNVLRAMPRNVGEAVLPAIESVLAARTGPLLWLGAIVGLWTVGSLIETVRDIMHRAYGTQPTRSFLRYRLSSVFIIVGAVALAMFGFALGVMLTAATAMVERFLPLHDGWVTVLSVGRFVPALALWGALYALFRLLTPSGYRAPRYPKWPGALFTAVWWLTVTALLPRVLGLAGGYDLTYGSLAGATITLLFFWTVGLGMVFGIELNAALADKPLEGYDAAKLRGEPTA